MQYGGDAVRLGGSAIRLGGGMVRVDRGAVRLSGGAHTELMANGAREFPANSTYFEARPTGISSASGSEEFGGVALVMGGRKQTVKSDSRGS
mmetsp:Transcript_19489/g.36508  ORF Transcript_19489/g.36508 Transcript_19489/m.36508 type:complete len:92 (-) Transcript_19489:311-586(-)